jgi:hypothetical protein
MFILLLNCEECDHKLTIINHVSRDLRMCVYANCPEFGVVTEVLIKLQEDKTYIIAFTKLDNEAMNKIYSNNRAIPKNLVTIFGTI